MPPIHEVMLAPISVLQADNQAEKITAITAPVKTEIPMPANRTEQEQTPALTLPEPSLPVHMSPYVDEVPAAPKTYASITEYEAPAGLPAVPPRQGEELTTIDTSDLAAAQEAHEPESLSSEIERIISGAMDQERPVVASSISEAESTPPLPHAEQELTALENLAYFTESLRTWHMPASHVGEQEQAEPIDSLDSNIEQLPDIPEADKKAMIAISHEVEERLHSLEPAEVDEVAPIISGITAATAKIQELARAETAEDLAMLEEAKLELETLCKELFDALDIEYDDASIHFFVKIMLLEQFQNAMDTAAYKDRLGTHEFKHRFPAFSAMAHIIAGEIFHFMLGRLALLQTKSYEQRQPIQSL